MVKFNIVCNNIIFKKFKEIDIFKIDLGKSLINRKENTLDIKDNFVEQYYQTNNRFVHKTGNIGSISIYTDISIPNDMLMIYCDNKLYPVQYENDDQTMKSYLSGILKSIEEHKIQSDNELKELIEKQKRWQDNSGKNGNKSYDLNQRLDRDSYKEELLKKRNGM